MKTLFSEEYYRKNWERFIKEIPGEHYINLEAELKNRMRIYDSIGLPETAIATIRKVEAQKIADTCKKLVMREMQTIKAIDNGEASFGYTTRGQEIKALGDFRTRFEFNCLQYADFKKKYEVV